MNERWLYIEEYLEMIIVAQPLRDQKILQLFSTVKMYYRIHLRGITIYMANFIKLAIFHVPFSVCIVI